MSTETRSQIIERRAKEREEKKKLIERRAKEREEKLTQLMKITMKSIQKTTQIGNITEEHIESKKPETTTPRNELIYSIGNSNLANVKSPLHLHLPTNETQELRIQDLETDGTELVDDTPKYTEETYKTPNKTIQELKKENTDKTEIAHTLLDFGHDTNENNENTNESSAIEREGIMENLISTSESSFIKTDDSTLTTSNESWENGNWDNGIDNADIKIVSRIKNHYILRGAKMGSLKDIRLNFEFTDKTSTKKGYYEPGDFLLNNDAGREVLRKYIQTSRGKCISNYTNI